MSKCAWCEKEAVDEIEAVKARHTTGNWGGKLLAHHAHMAPVCEDHKQSLQRKRVEFEPTSNQMVML
jgi:hypothetical protein